VRLVAGSVTDRREVRRFLEGALIGFTIGSVEYLLPDSMDAESRDQFVGFDQAEAGIILRGDDREIHLRWSQEGFSESLWVGASSGGEDLWSPNVRREAVGGKWNALIGFSIEEIVECWLPSVGDLESVWSIRLRAGGQFVVIALGEVDYESEMPTYVPDCVVAIFGEDVGRSYHPWAGVPSAWGGSS
jgi:hypothetical protein